MRDPEAAGSPETGRTLTRLPRCPHWAFLRPLSLLGSHHPAATPPLPPAGAQPGSPTSCSLRDCVLVIGSRAPSSDSPVPVRAAKLRPRVRPRVQPLAQRPTCEWTGPTETEGGLAQPGASRGLSFLEQRVGLELQGRVYSPVLSGGPVPLGLPGLGRPLLKN